MATIRDVARIANVSLATVSRVLNNSGRVSPKTREHVLNTVKSMGFTPNHLASSLKTSRTNNILVMVPEIGHQFYSGVLSGIEASALEYGLKILIGETKSIPERESIFIGMVKSRLVDGIVLLCCDLQFPVADSQLPPIVSLCEKSSVSSVPSVLIDDELAAREMVKYLISLGHRKIAVITGRKNQYSTVARLRGYKNELLESGIYFDESWVLCGDGSMQRTEVAVRRLISMKNRPTAIFCFSDEMAIVCISILVGSGLAVPSDVSVAGFDNIAHSAYCNPSLTTVSQPMEDMGIACMELLLPKLIGVSVSTCGITIKHSLVIRNSTAKAKF